MKKLIMFITILLVFLAGCSFHTGASHHNDVHNTNEETVDTDSSYFKLSMLDVGQGLCVLIESDGHYMVYDGGGRDSSSYVVSYLKNTCHVNAIDLMIVSHYDEDHIAGLIGILNSIPVKNVICPDYAVNTQIYDSFCRALEENNLDQKHPSNGDLYPIGNASVQIVNDGSIASDNENDHSLACRIEYGNTSVLLTGDCESATEAQMISSGLQIESDIYVAGHHGSATSSSVEFLHEVSPKQVLISCGENNTYGHPAEAMLERVAAIGADLYRTDKQGTITLTSDMKSYQFDQPPCDDWSPGIYQEPADKTTPAVQDAKYVLNTRSMIIHLPDCESVQKMSEKNKAYTDQDIDSLIESGYRPCQNCNPE